MKKISILLALFLAISTHAFGQTSKQAGENEKFKKQAEKLRPVIDAFLKQFVDAYNKPDADALALLYTEDATYIGTAGDVTQTRDKLRLGLKNSLNYFKEFSVTPDETGASGDLIYQRGTYSQKLNVPNQPVETYTGKYLIILRRQADKSWKIQMQMVSRDRPQR